MRCGAKRALDSGMPAPGNGHTRGTQVTPSPLTKQKDAATRSNAHRRACAATAVARVRPANASTAPTT